MIFLGGCAGYQLGNQQFFRNDIRSIHVPIIESESHRKFLGQQLTELVVKQIERDTPLMIADAGFADSFLNCRIVRDGKRMRTLDRFGEPRVLQTEWRVEVEWIDRSGRPLLSRRNLAITDDVEFIPESGQSLTAAHRELAKKIAQQIVGQLETDW